MTIHNVAPTVVLTGAANVDEGSTHTYTFTVTDPGNDTFVASADYPDCDAGGTNNGEVVPGSYAPTATGGSFDCNFPDGPASANVKMKVADSDGASGTGSESVQIVAVANVAPTLTAAADQTANEGTDKSFDLGSFTDPGPDAPWHVDVDWGDSSTHTDLRHVHQGRPRQPEPHLRRRPRGPHGHRHRHRQGPRKRLQDLQRPRQQRRADGRAHRRGERRRGLDAHLQLHVTDPGDDTFTATSGYPDCDAGGATGTLVGGSYAPTAHGGSFKCTFPDGPATANVKMKVDDSDGLSGTDSESVQVVAVANVAPVVTAGADQSAAEGASTAVDLGSFSDPAPNDGDWTVDVDWGDGSSHTSFPASATGNIGSRNHTYADGPDDHTVTVTVTDKDGGRRQRVVQRPCQQRRPHRHADRHERPVGQRGLDPHLQLRHHRPRHRHRRPRHDELRRPWRQGRREQRQRRWLLPVHVPRR